MDIERLREKIQRSQALLKDAMEELGDYSDEANALEDDVDEVRGGGKENKLSRILALMDE